ncbi:MAG TPA: C25 family cysteine peptidase, partial [Chitinophagaceae bacterium]|nr:C25 family cysteine peptidase [Chitinophagaceae bacterium]
MKRILPLLLIACSLSAKAQVYNNEWIDYSKTYYKFKVAVTGLYRITQPTLSSIGLGSTPAEYFQLWRNGQEIPIYTSVQTGAMASSDYIEFWGAMNDGKPDNILYRLPDYQLSDKWSLETDTAAYFLTVNTLGNSFHLQPVVNDVAGNVLPPEPYFMHTAGAYYKDKINSGRSELVGDSYTYSSSYEYGEGWTSNDIPNQSSRTFSTSSLFVYAGAGAPQPEVKVTAAGNAVHTRNIRIKVNADSIYGAPLNYYDYAKISVPVTIAQISAFNVNIEAANTGTEANDRMVLGHIELIYPHTFNLPSIRNWTFELPANLSGNYLEFTGFIFSGPAPVLYDLTNGKRYVADITNPVILKFALQPSSVPRKFVLADQAPANITAVTSFQQRNFINYGLLANQGEYLIIAHPALTNGANGTNPVNDYKDYRSSSQGGGYNTKIYIIDELVDQFGLGIKKHPLSIRNFLRWARVNYSAPLKHVFLIGKGVVYNQYRPNENNPDIEKLALMPTFGYPASDNMLSAEPGSSTPLTPIGRLSAINADEVALY